MKIKFKAMMKRGDFRKTDMSQEDHETMGGGPRRRHWHLDKTVSITHIFSTVAAVSTMVICLSKFDTRVTLLEQSGVVQNITQVSTDARQDKEADEFKKSVREDYRAIDDKLQRLIERPKL